MYFINIFASIKFVIKLNYFVIMGCYGQYVLTKQWNLDTMINSPLPEET